MVDFKIKKILGITIIELEGEITKNDFDVIENNYEDSIGIFNGKKIFSQIKVVPNQQLVNKIEKLATNILADIYNRDKEKIKNTALCEIFKHDVVYHNILSLGRYYYNYQGCSTTDAKNKKDIKIINHFKNSVLTEKEFHEKIDEYIQNVNKNIQSIINETNERNERELYKHLSKTSTYKDHLNEYNNLQEKIDERNKLKEKLKNLDSEIKAMKEKYILEGLEEENWILDGYKLDKQKIEIKEDDNPSKSILF